MIRGTRINPEGFVFFKATSNSQDLTDSSPAMIFSSRKFKTIERLGLLRIEILQLHKIEIASCRWQSWFRAWYWTAVVRIWRRCSDYEKEEEIPLSLLEWSYQHLKGILKYFRWKVWCSAKYLKPLAIDPNLSMQVLLCCMVVEHC